MRALILCALAGCAGAASGGGDGPGPAAGDFDALCHAEVRSGAIEVFPFSDKATKLNAWIEANVHDLGVRQIYFEEMPLTLSTEQDDLLRREAALQGISDCPLAGYVSFVVGMSYEAFSVDDCIAACEKRNAGAAVHVKSVCKRGCGGDL